MVTLITPTRDRHLLFSLTERWMKPALEKYSKDVQWIVADDGETPVTCTLGQQHLYAPSHKTVEGVSSFLGNMKRAMQAIKYDYVLIIEDDDWKHNDYINKMMSLFNKEGVNIVGEGCAKYYLLNTMQYYTHKNLTHSSWCQTGFRSDLYDCIKKTIDNCNTYLLDVMVWRDVHKERYTKSNVKPISEWTIGMKGLMRDAALGAGHTPRMYRSSDPYGYKLKEWIGEEAKEVYFNLIRNKQNQVLDVVNNKAVHIYKPRKNKIYA